MTWTKLSISQAIVLAVGLASVTALLLLGKKMGLDGDVVKTTIAILTPLLTAAAYLFKSPMDSKPTLTTMTKTVEEIPPAPPGGES